MHKWSKTISNISSKCNSCGNVSWYFGNYGKTQQCSNIYIYIINYVT